jgi:cysteine-rich repeat protein
MKSLVLTSFIVGTLIGGACASESLTPTAPSDSATLALGVTSVPEDYATIQEAIDATAPNGTVSVAAGVYQESFALKSSVTVVGAGRLATTVYGTVTANGVSNTSLSDLTLNGGLSAGDATGLTLENATFTIERIAVKGFGIGVDVLNDNGGGGESMLDTVEVTECSAQGIRISGGYKLTIQNSTVSYAGGDGIQMAYGNTPSQNVILTNNLIFANGYALLNGAGLRMEETVGFVISNTISVSNNIGLYCKAACANDHSIIWGNLQNYEYFAAPGDSNLNTDPLFNDAAEGDFTLRFDSPGIDAGSDTWAPATDAFGKQRPMGEGIDIGPYEFLANAPDMTLAITEIMANPTNEQTGEYVELYNFGAKAIDVTGFVLDDGDATDTLVGWDGGTATIPAGAYAVILAPKYDGEAYNIPGDAVLLTIASTAYLGSKLSTSDPIKLLAADGLTPIDTYSFPFNPGDGFSVEKDSLADGDVGSNWVTCPCGNTPGASNCASLPPNVSKEVFIAINEVMANPLSETTGEFIEFYNFGEEAIDMASFRINDGDAQDAIAGWNGGSTVLEPGTFAVLLDPDYAGQYSIPETALLLSVASTKTIGNGLAVNDPISLSMADGLSVIDTYTHTFDAGNGTSVEKVDAFIGDIPSNFGSSTCPSASSPGAVNCVATDGAEPIGGATIAITEVMANALDEDKGEYIELYNFGVETLDLAGYRIGDGDKEESLSGFNGGSTLLAPGGYAVILDAEYDAFYPIPGDAVLLTTPDTSIASGLSTNDPITLRAPKGAKNVDTFLFPFNPGNGVSAEKLDLVIGDVPQNWVASPCNASPGKDNCSGGDLGGDGSPVSTTGITVSEVMANPINEEKGEFIEIFNGGPVGVDVNGWWVSDGDSLDQIIGWNGGPAVIAPGQFGVILDPEFNNHYNLGDNAVKLTVTNNTLGNGLTTNDGISLYEGDAATVVDTFSFPWNPGNGFSLEKIALTAGDMADNWATSTCKLQNGDENNGSSPGAANCVDPHGFAGNNPLGQSCPYGAADCLSGLCAVNLLNGNNFCTSDCSQGPCPQGFECTDIQDVNYLQVCVPSGGGGAPDVTISEVLYDSPGKDTDVFVEIKGPPNTILDGLALVGINGSNGAIYGVAAVYGYIGASGYFVIAHPSANEALLDAADMTSKKVDFQNGPDSIQLRYGDVVVDAVAYGDFTSAVFAGEGTATLDVSTPGQSIVRIPGFGDTNDNSVDFAISIYPSPGLSNVICGNGAMEGPEQCDDGNLVSGDGCSSICEAE